MTDQIALQTLQRLEKRLLMMLKSNQRRQRELSLSIFQQQCPVKIGSVIEYTDNTIVKKGIITDFEYLNNQLCGIWFKQFKRDGTLRPWSSRVHDLTSIKIMGRSCDNCNNKGNKYYKDALNIFCEMCLASGLLRWEGDCSVCKHRTPNDPKRFCDQDAGDDGMNCCGDKFELIEGI